ncbi:platelet-activating factor acetylhydrolase [Pyrenophora tritici-repentis]|nr:platelet-activating factor acetylhydrolase [Pyrenophora tritici-repentis]
MDLPTVAFRIFYPCKQDSNEKAVKWIPNSQREYVSAYARFLGASNAFAGVLSNAAIVILCHHARTPNADLLAPPPKSDRWPVMMFSHGLGGTRNAYSHICGSLASHGVVVVAADHRDGSSPLSIHHTPEEKEKVKRVPYRNIAHSPSTEVYEARNEQLRIRLWELGMIHDALLKLDDGRKLTNVAQDQPKGKNMLNMFTNLMDVHQPGAIGFAGHSFGACTMIQFVKSVYYRPKAQIPNYKPLYTPTEDSSIVRQITPDTAWLRSQPMPCYDSKNGGKNLLAIASEGFYNWSSNLRETKRIIAKPPASQSPYPTSPAHTCSTPSPLPISPKRLWRPVPWVTTKAFGAKEPERVLRLNTRAILQVLRENGVRVANTSAADLELEDTAVKDASVAQDSSILSRTKDSVRGWTNISADSEQEEDARAAGKLSELGADKDWNVFKTAQVEEIGVVARGKTAVLEVKPMAITTQATSKAGKRKVLAQKPEERRTKKEQVRKKQKEEAEKKARSTTTGALQPGTTTATVLHEQSTKMPDTMATDNNKLVPSHQATHWYTSIPLEHAKMKAMSKKRPQELATLDGLKACMAQCQTANPTQLANQYDNLRDYIHRAEIQLPVTCYLLRKSNMLSPTAGLPLIFAASANFPMTSNQTPSNCIHAGTRATSTKTYSAASKLPKATPTPETASHPRTARNSPPQQNTSAR